MASLSHEIWSLLLENNITPSFNYVTSAENVADIFSRPDLELVGRKLAAKKQLETSRSILTHN